MLIKYAVILAAVYSLPLAASTYTNQAGHQLSSKETAVRATGVSLSYHTGEYSHEQQVRLSFTFTNTTARNVHGVMIRCIIKDPFQEELLNTFLKEQVVIPGNRSVTMDSYWVWDSYKDEYKRLWQVTQNGTAKIQADVVQVVYADGSMWFEQEYLFAKIKNSTFDEQDFLRYLVHVTNYNHSFSDGKTLLGLAVDNHLWNAFAFLLKKSPDFNQLTGVIWEKRTVLHTLCISRDMTHSEMLLKAGANPDIQGLYELRKMSPLHSMVMTRQYDLARLLLRYKANPFLKDAKGETPLQIAVSLKDWKMVQLLRSWKQLRGQ